MALPAGVRRLLIATLLAVAGAPPIAAAQPVQTATPRMQECGSVVIVRCDRAEQRAADDAKRAEAGRRADARRAERAGIEMDRVIIEGEGERQLSPEESIGRALGRPLLRQGEHSFAIGESAKCTCLNICPPWPLPCCQCTDRAGSRLSTAPGWKPTN
jgi:hypothetical protein